MQRVFHYDGEELILAILGRSEMIGLPESVAASPANRETVTASETVLLSIPWRVVAELSASSPDRSLGIDRQLARESLMLVEKLTTRNFCSLESRVARFLLEAERLQRRIPGLRLTQGMIAKIVGASRPKVNRCLKTLESRGLIMWRSRSVLEICDDAAIRRLL